MIDYNICLSSFCTLHLCMHVFIWFSLLLILLMSFPLWSVFSFLGIVFFTFYILEVKLLMWTYQGMPLYLYMTQAYLCTRTLCFDHADQDISLMSELENYVRNFYEGFTCLSKLHWLYQVFYNVDSGHDWRKHTRLLQFCLMSWRQWISKVTTMNQ